MNNPPNNLSRTQQASLEALRQRLQNLEEASAFLLKLTLSRPEGKLRAQLVDQVSVFDSIAGAMRRGWTPWRNSSVIPGCR